MDLPDPGIKPGSPALQADSLPAELPGKPVILPRPHLFDKGSSKLWRRQWQPTPVLLPGKIPQTEEPGRLQSMGLGSRTRLSNFTFTFHFHALEKEMATHSSVLVWRVPGTGEPGGLPSMVSHRVGHDLTTTWASLIAQLVNNPPAMQETPVRLLGREDPLEKG